MRNRNLFEEIIVIPRSLQVARRSDTGNSINKPCVLATNKQLINTRMFVYLYSYTYIYKFINLMQGFVSHSGHL